MSDYIKQKLNILRELSIKLTDEQKKHVKTLKSEIAVDNYCRQLILNGYDEKYGY